MSEQYKFNDLDTDTKIVALNNLETKALADLTEVYGKKFSNLYENYKQELIDQRVQYLLVKGVLFNEAGELIEASFPVIDPYKPVIDPYKPVIDPYKYG